MLLIATVVCGSLLYVVKKYRKVNPEKTFDKILCDKRVFWFSVRDLLFFFLSIITLLFGYSVAVGIPAGISELGEFPFMTSGLFSSLIIVLTGIITRVIYGVISRCVAKVFHRRFLKHIGENSRVWAFIAASTMFASGTIMNGDILLQTLGYTAIAMILSRVLWLDIKKGAIKKFINSFFRLPYYAMLIYSIGILVASNSFFIRFVGVSWRNLAVYAGITAAIIITGYQYRKEFDIVFKPWYDWAEKRFGVDV